MTTLLSNASATGDAQGWGGGQGQVEFAKGLKQRSLDAEVSEADDLQGQT